ncbi:hypothetical protein HY967_04070 [Candidatus Jorgensenbacteria bacterium]|nr:hypothetical protein [Candidatus Jorgensenbacteria bacterium]
MWKKMVVMIVVVVCLIIAFYLVLALISSKPVHAPIAPAEVERRVFRGPTSAPFVKGPTSSPPTTRD